MGGQQIECPLCCDKTFDSKQSLFDHLNDVMDNLYCPLCNIKCTTLEGLTEHLSLYDCQTETVQNIVIYEQGIDIENIENSAESKDNEVRTVSDGITTESGTPYIVNQTYECVDESGEGNKMYVELLSSKSKPILETGELKLIKEEGESRYMIVTQDSDELQEETEIVTKQNNDGTISLTTVKDIKMESETLIVPEPASNKNMQPTYTCNACKVSFLSVKEHIDSYHGDEDVIVEEAPNGTEQNQVIVEHEAIEIEDCLATNDKQAPRRVITDTGDIVEEPVIFKGQDTEITQDTIDQIIKHPKLVLDKQGRIYTRRYVQIDKLENVNKTPTNSAKTDFYHKVITKELQTKNGLTMKMLHCISCNINVSNLDEFQTHPCKTLKYSCTRCPAAYENSKSLCAHMKVHKIKTDGSPDVPTSYECEVCSTVFPTNKSLKLHKRMHDPVKSRPIEPPVETTDNKESIRTVYRCNICEKMIPLDYRAIHENSHKTSDKMNCSICNKKFTSIEYLEMHMNVHNLDKAPVNKQDKSLPYKCLYCNRRFARPHEKVKHERIHTGEKPHSCEICGKSFRVSYCLTLHMRTHTGARPYACPHCGKRFKAHSVYNHHLLTHSEVRAYKCPYCPKAFKTSVQLAGHKNSHTKPFSCQHCNRPFASLYAVRVHTETHARQNNLKFSCSLCGASYARAFALKDHVKHVHDQDVHTADTLLENNQDEYWMARENTTDTESLNKDLQPDITELEMNSNELIIP